MNQEKEENTSLIKRIDKSVAKWLRDHRVRIEDHIASLQAKLEKRQEETERRVTSIKEGNRSKKK